MFLLRFQLVLWSENPKIPLISPALKPLIDNMGFPVPSTFYWRVIHKGKENTLNMPRWKAVLTRRSDAAVLSSAESLPAGLSHLDWCGMPVQGFLLPSSAPSQYCEPGTNGSASCTALRSVAAGPGLLLKVRWSDHSHTSGNRRKQPVCSSNYALWEWCSEVLLGSLVWTFALRE